MNNKKLTLKLLQQQLEELKIKTIANKKINNKLPTAAQRAEVISKKGKNMPKASMSFNPLGILMSLSWISFILSKFPFLTTLFTKILGIKKASILFTILIYLRKGFIVTNAIIGIWLMFKVTGWDQGSFLMSAAAIGHSYMEFFITFIYKAFNYLYNIFDNKIIPNIGSGQNPYSVYNGWNIRPMKDNNYLSMAENARSWYQSPTQISNTSSWSDWFPSWKAMFYIGITIVTIATLYSGYVYINNCFDPTTNIDPKGKGIESLSQGTNKSVVGKISDVLIFNRLRNISDAASYLSQKYLPYMDKQEITNIQLNNPHSQKYQQFYPYTSYKPYESLFNRLKMCLFSESAIEYETRMRDMGVCNRTEFVQGSSKDILTVPLTPMQKGFGINPNLPPAGFSQRI